MRTTLLELARLGCTRPAALIDAPTNTRAKHAWTAAFAAFHPQPDQAAGLLRLVPDEPQPGIAEWLSDIRSDALVVSSSRLLDDATIMRVRGFGRPIANLYWTHQQADWCGGIDQCDDHIAAHAVDLVVTQLNSNETGFPEIPRITLFPGRWMPAPAAVAFART